MTISVCVVVLGAVIVAALRTWADLRRDAVYRELADAHRDRAEALRAATAADARAAKLEADVNRLGGRVDGIMMKAGMR